MIRTPSDEECGVTTRFVANAFKCEGRVSGILVCPDPVQTRSVSTIAESTICFLRTTAELCSTWHYTLLLLLHHV